MSDVKEGSGNSRGGNAAAMWSAVFSGLTFFLLLGFGLFLTYGKQWGRNEAVSAPVAVQQQCCCCCNTCPSKNGAKKKVRKVASKKALVSTMHVERVPIPTMHVERAIPTVEVLPPAQSADVLDGVDASPPPQRVVREAIPLPRRDDRTYERSVPGYYYGTSAAPSVAYYQPQQQQVTYVSQPPGQPFQFLPQPNRNHGGPQLARGPGGPVNPAP